MLRAGVLLLSIVLTACTTIGRASDPGELAATWNSAHVAVPTPNGIISGKMGDLETKRKLDGLSGRIPTIVYLHGCLGLEMEAYIDVLNLALAGYAVVAPDSFGRPNRIANCDPKMGTTENFPQTFAYREAEIRYAAERVRELTWVDQVNVFLMGFSEGGHAIALYRGNEYKAHIITAWTCYNRHPNWRHLDGLHAPRGKPVLAIVGAQDPWFANEWHRGHCGELMDRRVGRSVVIDTAAHYVTWWPEAEKALLEFLRTHVAPSQEPAASPAAERR